MKDGWLTCDRDQPTHVDLVAPAKVISHAPQIGQSRPPLSSIRASRVS